MKKIYILDTNVFLTNSNSIYEFKNNDINRVLQSDLYNYFTSNDYHFVNWSHADLIFVHNDFQD